MRTTTLLPTRIHNHAHVTRDSIHDEINDFFRNAFTGFPFLWGRMTANPFDKPGGHEGIIPSLDMTSDEKTYAVVVELPGIEPDDIKLEAKDNTLSISGEKKNERRDKDNTHVLERSYGTFCRTIELPEDADIEHIEAASKNGVLTVTIPRKAQEQPKSRKIEIAKA